MKQSTRVFILRGHVLTGSPKSGKKDDYILFFRAVIWAEDKKQANKVLMGHYRNGNTAAKVSIMDTEELQVKDNSMLFIVGEKLGDDSAKHY